MAQLPDEFTIFIRVETVAKTAIPNTPETWVEADTITLVVIDGDDPRNRAVWPLVQSGRIELDGVLAARLWPRQRYQVTFKPLDPPQC